MISARRCLSSLERPLCPGGSARADARRRWARAKGSLSLWNLESCGLNKLRLRLPQMEPLNPGSDWKACTCDGPFADMPPNMEPESSVREQIVGIWRQNGRSEKVAELDELISEAGGAAAVLEQVQQKYAQRPNGTPTAHQRLTIFRSGCGEMTLMRPEEGISAASIDRDREDFVKQFRRAERLDRMAADGLASPAGKKMNLPSLAGPSNESQVLLDQMLLESDLAPMEGGSAVTNPRRRTFGNGAAAAQPGQMPEPEPEPESAPHGDALVRTLVHDHVVVRPGVLQDRTQSRYVHGVKHYMGHELWVGNIIDAELEGGKGVCEKALWSVRIAIYMATFFDFVY